MLDDSLLKKIGNALSYRFLIGDINFSNEEKEAIREEFFLIYSKNSEISWRNALSNHLNHLNPRSKELSKRLARERILVKNCRQIKCLLEQSRSKIASSI